MLVNGACSSSDRVKIGSRSNTNLWIPPEKINNNISLNNSCLDTCFFLVEQFLPHSHTLVQLHHQTLQHCHFLILFQSLVPQSPDDSLQKLSFHLQIFFFPLLNFSLLPQHFQRTRILFVFHHFLCPPAPGTFGPILPVEPKIKERCEVNKTELN